MHSHETGHIELTQHYVRQGLSQAALEVIVFECFYPVAIEDSGNKTQ